MQTELVVALDYPNTDAAEKLMQQLSGLDVIYKVGLELFLGAGPNWVKNLGRLGTRVFLDLKFHDIPNTTGQAVVQAAKLGAEFVTVHLCGGKLMLDEIDTRLQEALISGEITQKPKVLGVTVLTSFKEEDWIANIAHFARIDSVRSIQESVFLYASLANDHPAIHGIVCSPKEVDMVRTKYKDLFLMVPGIRPKGSALNDQTRVMTPGDAMKAGASAIVVGRPITQSPDPRKVAEEILKEIGKL